MDWYNKVSVVWWNAKILEAARLRPSIYVLNFWNFCELIIIIIIITYNAMGEHSIIISYDNPASFIVGTAWVSTHRDACLPNRYTYLCTIAVLQRRALLPSIVEQWSLQWCPKCFSTVHVFYVCIIPCDISMCCRLVISGGQSSANNLRTGVRLCTPIERTSRTSA